MVNRPSCPDAINHESCRLIMCTMILPVKGEVAMLLIRITISEPRQRPLLEASACERSDWDEAVNGRAEARRRTTRMCPAISLEPALPPPLAATGCVLAEIRPCISVIAEVGTPTLLYILAEAAREGPRQEIAPPPRGKRLPCPQPARPAGTCASGTR